MKADRTRKEQGARLRLAREQAGFRSARSAALECGWPESSYRAHEAGTRTIGQDDAERYASRYRMSGVKVTAKSILFGDDTSIVSEPNATSAEKSDRLPAVRASRADGGRPSPKRELDDVFQRVESMWGDSDDLKDVLRLLYALDETEVGRARTILFAAFAEKVAVLAARNGRGSNSGRGAAA